LGKLKLDDASDWISPGGPAKARITLEATTNNTGFQARQSRRARSKYSSPGRHTRATTLYRVVLQAIIVRFWEVPIAQRGNIGKYRANCA